VIEKQALILYSGVEALLAGSFTLAHGVTPSTCKLYMAPQAKPLPVVGTLVISYGSQAITFPDCHAQGLNVEVDGLTRWELTIMDHRWRWCFGEISGEYNVRDAGGKLIPDSVKSARDLAKLLFEEMGEPRADVSRVPADVYPERKWEVARPDQELAQLCDEFGLRVVLSMPNNKVMICRQGEGADLPKDSVEDAQQLFELPDRPDVIRFRAGRTQYQRALRLVPVAEEANGKLVPLNEVSYAPKWTPPLKWTKDHPWGCFDPPFANTICPPETDERKRQKFRERRELANKWVFRGYRIDVEQSELDRILNGDFDLSRILPLNSFQLVKKTGILVGFEGPFAKTESRQGNPPVIFGRWNKDSSLTNLDVGYPALSDADFHAWARDLGKRRVPTGDYIRHPAEKYDKPFTLDVERGVVLFADPVFELLTIDDLTNVKVPPLLYLVTSFGLREKLTRAWDHVFFDRRTGAKNGTKPKVIYRSDVNYRQWLDTLLPGNPQRDNKEEVEKYAKYYLDQEERRLQLKTPSSATYTGFRLIVPDGAITQVTWFVNENGEGRTRASRNREEPAVAETFQQKRINEQLAALVNRNGDAREKDRGKFGE